MKRIFITFELFILTIILVGFMGCSMPVAEPGHELVVIKKPWFFGHGGTEKETIKTGRTTTWITTDVIDVNMQPIRKDEEMKDTMSKDGVPLEFHAIITLQVTDAVKLIENFGPQWYENNIEQPFQNFIRQSVRKRGMNETAIETTAIDAIDLEIKEEIEKFLTSNKIPVKLVTVTVGKANPPDSIKSQRIETAAEQQRIQTETQKKLAEDQRKMAEESRALADNAYRESMRLEPSQWLELQRINMLKEAAGKGATFIIGSDVAKVYNVK